MNSYHDTVQSSVQKLIEFEGRAIKQEETILGKFKARDAYFSMGFSPSQLYIVLRNTDYNWPLTSIRRAISNLTRDGKLIKTDKKCKGLYGRDEFIWRVVL